MEFTPCRLSLLLLVIVHVFLQSSSTLVSAFASRPSSWTTSKTSSLILSAKKASGSSSNGKSLVVISPPGGVGEVAAVKAACLGTAVRWFVISGGSKKNNLELSQEALDSIDNAGGKIQLAGADAESLLISENDDSGQISALSAVSQWCGRADALLCTFDGIQQEKTNAIDAGKEDPP